MPCLKDLYITATPDLPYPPTQLRKWVEANGGRWLPTVNKNTTHLICSKDAWKRAKHAPTSDASAKNDLVGKAKEVEGCYIVSYDWLEDCLHKKRRLSEKRYAWGRREKVRRRERRMGRVEGVWDRECCISFFLFCIFFEVGVER